MLTIPATTITALGGTSSSPYEDVVDGTTEIATGVPCSIIEVREAVATESDPQARIIRYYIGRVPPGTDTSAWQRIRDDRTGHIYVIDNVTEPQHPAVVMDTRLDLRRVT